MNCIQSGEMAAIGTALPESVVTLVAVLSGSATTGKARHVPRTIACPCGRPRPDDSQSILPTMLRDIHQNKAEQLARQKFRVSVAITAQTRRAPRQSET